MVIGFIKSLCHSTQCETLTDWGEKRLNEKFTDEMVWTLFYEAFFIIIFYKDKIDNDNLLSANIFSIRFFLFLVRQIRVPVKGNQ